MDKASKSSSSKRRFFLPIREKISSMKKQSSASPSPLSSVKSSEHGTKGHGLAIAGSPESLSSPSWPKAIPLQPEGQMQALVYHHEVNSMFSGKIFCWTYISKGLAKLGQKEVVFTVRRREKSEAADKFPPGPLEWFSILYSLAKNGQIVDEFHQTRFESSPLLDRLDVRLIIYYPPLELQNVPLSIIPRDTLQAIPLTASEAQVAQSYGVMPVISHLGSSERYFPVMPWIDRDRKDCIAMWQMKGSLRDKLPMLSFVGVNCVKRNTTITAYIPRNAEPKLAAEVKASPASTVLSLDCYPYKDSDSGMVWHQGITPSPRAYGTGASCISLAFIIFCPQQNLDDLRLMEDGICLLLTDSTFLEIRKAFLQQTPIQITFGDIQFSLEFESHASQPRESHRTMSENAPPLLAFGGRFPQWALKLGVDHAPVPNQPIRIPFEPFSPAHCVFNLRPNTQVEQSSGNTIKRPGSVKIYLHELKIDKEKGCDRCDILYRAIKEYLAFANQEQHVVLQFTPKKAGLVCAVHSQRGLVLILDFATREDKCHWLTPSNILAASPEVSVNRLAEIQQWMNTCRSTHTICSKESQPVPRMRFLDLGQSRVRLCKSKIPEEPYGTISHCWIFPDEIVTTNKNFHEYSSFGLEISKLPEQVQTAIQVFKSLGIRYLWVDSLCITQDDDEDWRTHTERTAEIYKASNLTIAVSSNVGCAEGCFMNEEPKYPVKKLRWASIGGVGSYVVEAGYSSIHTPFYERMQREEHQTMLHRASSVHQERQYSRRVLYVGANEVVYKCRESCRCECGFEVKY